MDYQEKADIAMAVYRYLIEERMIKVAEKYCKTSMYFSQNDNSHIPEIMNVGTVKCVSEMLREYNFLKQNMVKLVAKYSSDVQLPRSLTTWQKVEYLMEYFRSFMPHPSVTVPQPPSLTYQTLEHANLAEPQAISIRQPSNTPARESATNMTGKRLIYHILDDGSVTTSVMDGNLTVYYMVGDEKNELVSVTLNDTNDLYSFLPQSATENHIIGEYVLQPFPENNMPELIALEPVQNADPLAVGQQQMGLNLPEIGSPGHTLEIGSVAKILENGATAHMQTAPEPQHEVEISIQKTPPVEPALGTTLSLDSVMAMLAALDEVVPDKTESLTKNTGKTESPATNAVDTGKTDTPVENEMDTDKNEALATSKEVEQEALDEWNRIRAINISNLDSNLRQANYEAEMIQRLEEVLSQKPTTEESMKSKKSRPSPKAKVRISVSVNKHKVVKQGDKKRPVAEVKVIASDKKKRKVAQSKPRKKEPLMPTSTSNVAVQEMSDSSECASSMEEDDAIRQMAENVKRFRRTRKRQLLTGPDRPSNPVPLNPIPAIVTEYESLATPAKKPKKTPVRALRSGRKKAQGSTPAKEKTSTAKQQRSAKSSDQKTPVRSSTRSRSSTKPVVESRPAKSRTPRTPRQKTPKQGSSTSKRTPSDASPPASGRKEQNMSSPGSEDGEAAIYAVLAQLHGK